MAEWDTSTVSDTVLARLLWLLPAIMLVAAIAPWPYGYYKLLRLVVCICAGVLAYQSYQGADERVTAWVVGLFVLALLYNPIIPVHLTREIWLPINLASAAFFVGHLWSERKRAGE